jgi:hypothetical protein
MLNKLIIYSFILFLFLIIITHFYRGRSILEGLDSPSPSPSNSDIGVTVGTYSAKLDALGKIVDSMQSIVLGLLPIVTKNTSDNAKNQQAIQAIIANQNKT